MNEVIIWIYYGSMDKYPREVYANIALAKKKAIRLLGFDLDDPESEGYDSEIADEWKRFENGSREFNICDCEFEFHRVKIISE